MILSQTLPDTANISGKQSAGSSSASQDRDAQDQFNGILANLGSQGDGTAAVSQDSGKGDPTSAPPSGQTFNAPTFSAPTFNGPAFGGPTVSAASGMLLPASASATPADVSAQASKLSTLMPSLSTATQGKISLVPQTARLSDAGALRLAPPASSSTNLAAPVVPLANASAPATPAPTASSAGATVSTINDFLAGLPSSLAGSQIAATTTTTGVKATSMLPSRHATDPKTSSATSTDPVADTAPQSTSQVAAFLSGALGVPVAIATPQAAPPQPATTASATSASNALSAESGAETLSAATVTGTSAPSKASYPTPVAASTQTPGAGPTSSAGPVMPDAQSGASAQSQDSFPQGGSTHKDDAPAAASIVKSVTVETQLAPAPTLSPMQQVIDTVQKLAVGPAETTASAAAPAVTTQPTSASRTMTLVLEPENLGTVTVKMQLRGGSLDLQIDVSNAQTLGLLTKDKDSLAAAMSSQDYAIGTLTLRASDTQNASQGNDNGSQNQGQGSSQGSFSSQNGNGQGGNGSQAGAGFSGGSSDDRETRRNAPGRSDAQASRLDAGVSSPQSSSGLYI